MFMFYMFHFGNHSKEKEIISASINSELYLFKIPQTRIISS